MGNNNKKQSVHETNKKVGEQRNNVLQRCHLFHTIGTKCDMLKSSNRKREL